MMNSGEQGLVFIAVVIGVLCAWRLCICCLEDNNDQPRPSFQELVRTIKPAGNNGLKSIRVVHFNARGSQGSIECVVCLSNLAHGEEAKILTNCNHWFHVKCIDTWFQSNSTCPICRTMVGLPQKQGSVVQPNSGQVLIDIPAESRIREWPVTASYLNSL